MNKVGLYLRVSTEEQKDKGHSLEYQKNRMLDYCEKNKLRNHKFYDDGGYSAKDDKRPAYQRMLKDIRNKKIDKIIFLKIDRLSRNVIDYKKFTSICLLNDVEMISLSEDIQANAIGEFSQGIIIALAEMERKQVSERTKAGMVGMLEKGMYPFGGRMPLGISKTKDKKLYFNKDIEKVKWMHNKHLKGHSFAGIGRMYTQQFGIKVHKNFVESILKSNIYSGIVNYEGEKYKLFEGLKTWNCDPKHKNKRVRNVKEHKYVLDYLLPNFKKTTIKKKLRTTGEFKEYKYYISKDNNSLKINEQKLLDRVKSEAMIGNSKLKSIKKEKMKKLNELYVLTKMNISEFNIIAEKIRKKAKELTMIEQIEKIDIDNNGMIKVVLESRKNIKFNYQYL